MTFTIAINCVFSPLNSGVGMLLLWEDFNRKWPVVARSPQLVPSSPCWPQSNLNICRLICKSFYEIVNLIDYWNILCAYSDLEMSTTLIIIIDRNFQFSEVSEAFENIRPTMDSYIHYSTDTVQIIFP